MLDKAKTILNTYWGHQDFRGSQAAIINHILRKTDTLALMPTGGGKSICYQVPAMVMEGICIVVSPLVALIQNQVEELKNKGIKAVALTGGLSFEDVNALLDNCLYGNYKFLYLSPERLQQPLIQERIKGMNVNLVAIDEAHCISQWGNDFRPAYLHCAILRELVPKAPLIALTATATPRVVDDIVQNLELNEAKIFKDSFSRNNIGLLVEHREDKRFRLKQILEKNSSSAIVYVRSRKMSVQLSDFLLRNGLKASFFHGGLSGMEKKKRLKLWLDNKVHVMVATNAFGMGVDKPDVRTVVHYQIPDSLESYFQEVGRAGRDGLTSTALLITNEADRMLAKQQFLESLPDSNFLKTLYRKLNSFHQISYGELPLETYPFPFAKFCKHYELDSNLTYQGLKILDQNSIISLSENFKQRTTIQFVSKKQHIFSYLDSHPSYQTLIQTLLRTYGGILEFETKVDISLLVKKTGLQESVLHTMLKQLQKDEVVAYKSNEGDFEITFLAPREDDLTINSFSKKIKSLHQIKRNNLQSMLDFIENSRTCRNRFLLKYFGEATNKNCGKCDICIQSKKTSSFYLKSSILDTLKNKSLTSRELVAQIDSDEKEVLKILKHLLEEEQIELNQKNEYSLATK
ncbi:RecQ family ATP-dependent DNA helicase [Flagellimonas meridianipacifica]|uniref:ATP-dependent DNA helicase RecQ n=1 Tax=Flagellimonas meridianipacifica TaxID=1080225 RepID=A0A2T0MCL8_9FLAO|nr:ATP-dependent DNA helicase RecQ [Allomuricauda pacifica]PRX55210.1 ATP-dependent DNA helicase RecQ [Allomuricauda pacifica]